MSEVVQRFGNAAQGEPSTALAKPKQSRASMHAKRVERQRKSHELLLAGASYRQIADATGVSTAQAYADVQAVFSELAKLRITVAERNADVQNARLNKWLLFLHPKIQSGDVKAIEAGIKIEERRAKLLGLDKPTKHAFTTPDGEKPYDPKGMMAALKTETLEALMRDMKEAGLDQQVKEAVEGEVVAQAEDGHDHDQATGAVSDEAGREDGGAVPEDAEGLDAETAEVAFDAEEDAFEEGQ